MRYMLSKMFRLYLLKLTSLTKEGLYCYSDDTDISSKPQILSKSEKSLAGIIGSFYFVWGVKVFLIFNLPL